MDRIVYDILDSIDEGIVILNEKLEIVFLNSYMKTLFHISSKNSINQNIYTVFPSINKNYFIKIINSVLYDDKKMFLSAAMHKDILEINNNINLRISNLEKDSIKFILIEFIDVTNEFLRINQLKKYVKRLCTLNKELKEKKQIIKQLAFYDGLTGLANRTLFFKIADKMCRKAKKDNKPLGVMFIDVDRFKLINDTHGHKVGDNILSQVAKILEESSRREDVVARFGGDEFLILLPFIESDVICKDIADQINKKVKEMENNLQTIKVSVSIGISIISENANIDELIVNADKAMYEVKKMGGNSYYIL